MEARLRQQKREETYRIYLTDALMAIANNTSNYVGINGLVQAGAHLDYRYADTLYPQKPEKQEEQKEDNRTMEEQAIDMWERMRKGGKK